MLSYGGLEEVNNRQYVKLPLGKDFLPGVLGRVQREALHHLFIFRIQLHLRHICKRAIVMSNYRRPITRVSFDQSPCQHNEHTHTTLTNQTQCQAQTASYLP